MLNPDRRVLDTLIRGLARNEKKGMGGVQYVEIEKVVRAVMDNRSHKLW